MAITLTESAARQIKTQLARRGRGKGLGLRASVKKVGCSGFGYTFDYADEMRECDRSFASHGAAVVVGVADLSFLDGSRLDFVRDGLKQMYAFANPNVRRQCRSLRRAFQPEGDDRSPVAMTRRRFGFGKRSERFQ